MAQRVAQFAVKFHRPRIAPERFRAVGIVDRGGRADVIRLAAFAVQGKPHGRGQMIFVMREQVPNLRPVDAIVRRGPHLHLPLVAPIKTVGHDAVFVGQPAGGHIRLHRAGDAGKTRRQFGDFAAGHQLPQFRHHGHVFFTQAGNR